MASASDICMRYMDVDHDYYSTYLELLRPDCYDDQDEPHDPQDECWQDWTNSKSLRKHRRDMNSKHKSKKR